MDTSSQGLLPSLHQQVIAFFYISLCNNSFLMTIGDPGNITVSTKNDAPLFYVYNDQLWHYHNSSTILPVNVQNSTSTSQVPLQLATGKTRDGIRGGGWRWQGTQLIYEQGKSTNSGVYYFCRDMNGLMGLFTTLIP